MILTLAEIYVKWNPCKFKFFCSSQHKTFENKKECANEEHQQIILRKVFSCKINPEGTRGPIWLVVVPLFRSCSWLHCGATTYKSSICESQNLTYNFI